VNNNWKVDILNEYLIELKELIGALCSCGTATYHSPNFNGGYVSLTTHSGDENLYVPSPTKHLSALKLK